MEIKNTFMEALFNRGKVLSKAEILAVAAEYSKAFGKPMDEKNLLKYLSRHGYVKRVFSGIYYVNSFDERNRGFFNFEDREIAFMALEKLGVKWYVGMESSLHAQGKGWQTPNRLSIVNDRFSGSKDVLGLRVRFFKAKGGLMFGLKKARTRNGIVYLHSDPAKTYLDRVYFHEANRLARVKNTRKYLARYPAWVGRK